MHISEKLIFVDLHKTGSSFVSQALDKIVGGRSTRPHIQISSNNTIRGKTVLGTIRNPWDWYLSLWAYGCDNRGDFYGKVIKSDSRYKGLGWRQDPLEAASAFFFGKRSGQAALWQKVYRDVNDASLFRDWLRMVHDENYWFDFGEGYGQTTLSKFAGLYTYRYLKLYCCKKYETKKLKKISAYDQLVEFDLKNCFVDIFLKNENLNSDLLAALQSQGIEISDADRELLFSKDKVNTSSKKKGVSFYYDSETIDLVLERDKLIGKKFAYIQPCLDKNEFEVQKI